MSRAANDTGLPAWLLTPRMAVVTGAAIAITFSVVMGIGYGIAGWWQDVNGTSPTCFLLNAAPHVPGNRAFDGGSERADRYRSERQFVVDKVQPAAERCTPDACKGPARAAYQKAVKDYVSTRARTASGLDVNFGEAGLSFAHRLYDTTEDDRIVGGMRAAHAAGLLDVGVMRDYEAPARMLLFREPGQFLPCRKE